ncbi:MAG: 16S rRNA (uracil(1498)-N(3))-methyltransferase [Thermosynechococcaceae cyanobacterium]
MPQLQRLAISSQQLHESKITLTPEQQHYLGRVLRLQGGDRFIAMNGQGQWWLAELQNSSLAHIVDTLAASTELSIPVVLMVAPTKGNHFDQVVRCTTELGVKSLVPVLSDRTVLKPSPQKSVRWQRIATEAAEQSCRQVIPNILTPMTFSAALHWSQQEHPTATQYICVTAAEAPGLLGTLERTTGTIVMTGPEGGWTPQEEQQAIAAGYQPVSLGRRILRAATAPVAAMSLVAAYLDQQDAHSLKENCGESGY